MKQIRKRKTWGEIRRQRRQWWSAMLIMTALLAIWLFALVGCSAPNVASVKLSDRAKEKLSLYYDSYVDSMKVEFAFCCYGRYSRDTLYIDNVEIPPQLHYPYNVIVRFDLCDPMIAWGHAHPRGIKRLSKLDENMLNSRPEFFTILMYKEVNGQYGLSLYKKQRQ